MVDEGIDRRFEALGITEKWGDVTKKDPRDWKIRDGSNERLDLHAARFASTRRTPRRDTTRTNAITTPESDETPPLATSVEDLARLTADPSWPRRIVIATLLALVITALEAIVAFWHHPYDAPPEHVVATTIVLERARPTPRPTPTPVATPTPTPPPLVRATFAPVTERAAPRAHVPAGGTSAVRPRVVHPVHPQRAAAAAPGNGEGAGSDVGTGNGAGAGAGSGGTGSGAVDADAPCGYVDFIPSESPKIVGSISYETIRATVHYPDGHSESDDFPYPWVYSDWMNTDPWSPLNVAKNNLTVFAQLPPPGADTHRYNDVIRYILDHTTPSGHTVLQPCPKL